MNLGAERVLEEICAFAELAKRDRVNVVLVGGAAMTLYGSPRLTGDIDFVATSVPRSTPAGPALSFGGMQTKTPSGIAVDLIIRRDVYRKLYEAVFENTLRHKLVPCPVASPEIMLPIKLAAGRDKDREDLRFLALNVSVNWKKAHLLTSKFMGVYAVEELKAEVEIAKWQSQIEKKRKGGR